MPLNLPGLLDVVKEFATPDQSIYLVGGALRDRLLGSSSHDLDFALKKDAIHIGRAVADRLKGAFYILDAERGTARVLLDHTTSERYILDFANFRANTIEEDLRSRDFTANALAMDLHDPETIIDPLHGREDILAHRLRACSSTSFSDDPVRVLRSIRLALDLGFSLNAETNKGLVEAVPLLNTVSIERQRDELFIILHGDHVLQAFEELNVYGILTGLLPELAALVGFDQNGAIARDAWQHTLAASGYYLDILRVLVKGWSNEKSNPKLVKAFERLTPFREKLNDYFDTVLNPLRSFSSILMLAVLYHDVGKISTRRIDAQSEYHFDGHDQTGGDLARQRAMALALSRDEVNFIESFVRNHLTIHELAREKDISMERAAFRFFKAAGTAGVADALFSLADLLAAYEDKIAPVRWEKGIHMCTNMLDTWFNRYDQVIAPPLLLNGDDLMQEFKLSPGPMIGGLLADLEEAQAAGEVRSPEEARQFIKSHLRKS